MVWIGLIQAYLLMTIIAVLLVLGSVKRMRGNGMCWSTGALRPLIAALSSLNVFESMGAVGIVEWLLRSTLSGSVLKHLQHFIRTRGTSHRLKETCHSNAYSFCYMYITCNVTFGRRHGDETSLDDNTVGHSVGGIPVFAGARNERTARSIVTATYSPGPAIPQYRRRLLPSSLPQTFAIRCATSYYPRRYRRVHVYQRRRY